MLANVSTPRADPVSRDQSRPSRSRVPEVVAWGALGLLLLLGVPFFLRMGLFADVAYYELFARSIIHGGILERDVLVYFRPPTMGLILAGVHWLMGGWRAVGIRLLDLAFVVGVVWFLVSWLPREFPRVWRIWTAVMLLGFYLSTTEWCHAQPDIWMLLPALAALTLRWRQVVRMTAPKNALPVVGLGALAEGLCWGIACLFKPYVVVPGLLCWLLAVVLVWKISSQPLTRLTVDAFGLLIGGSIMGGLWMAWLWWDGGWSYFWEDFRVWVSGYNGLSIRVEQRIEYLFFHHVPWSLIHLVALPVACRAILRVLAKGWKSIAAETVAWAFREALLAAFYLGWFGQANFLQSQFDYHLTPTIFLAVTLIAGQLWLKIEARQVGGDRWWRLRSPTAWVLLLGFLGFAAGRSPLLEAKRLVQWPVCWEPSSFRLRDELALEMAPYDDRFDVPPVKWVDLHAVADYLRRMRVSDGELTCHGKIHTVHLFLELDVAPSVRYPFLYNAIDSYPQNRELIHRELSASSQRFVVSDLRMIEGAEVIEAPGPRKTTRLIMSGNIPKDLLKVFPWSEPIVFRSGPYLVHKVDHSRPLPPLWFYQ